MTPKKSDLPVAALPRHTPPHVSDHGEVKTLNGSKGQPLEVDDLCTDPMILAQGDFSVVEMYETPVPTGRIAPTQYKMYQLVLRQHGREEIRTVRLAFVGGTQQSIVIDATSMLDILRAPTRDGGKEEGFWYKEEIQARTSGRVVRPTFELDPEGEEKDPQEVL
jgi:hypothetical protein